MRIPKEIRWKPTGNTLGEGGQAQVQEVQDSKGEYGGNYALKGLAKGKPRQAYDRFYREIAAVKRLQHPYIVRVVDSSSPADDFHYYVMELVEGARTLQSILDVQDNPFIRKPLASIDLFIKLCEAISACEKCAPKVIHRDLSPTNILLVPDGSPRIIDFGVCQIDGDETITLTDEGVGTVNYMAPECESGSAVSIGSYSDLYSAGKILWSLITGQRAFAREKAAFTTKSMSHMFPNSPETWHLHHIFAKTIRHDPAHRWQNADEAVIGSNRVRRLILGGFPAIEEAFDFCPVCGVGKLGQFKGSHEVFGNPPPDGIYARQCSHCGICLAINGRRHRQSVDEMRSLE